VTAAAPAGRAQPSIGTRIVEAIGSFWLAITLLSFLFVLVAIGTLEQTHTSLFEVQRRYFESAFVFHDVYGIPVPLPGVYLLLVLLGMNLIVGGIVRLRKDATTWGILVTHLGILLMLGGSAIEFYFSQKGQATIAEGATTSEFQSYHEWEIAIAKARDAGPVEEFVIEGSRFMHLGDDERARFTSDALPFELVVQRVYKNCVPGSPAPGRGPPIDGISLAPQPPNKESELDIAGAYVSVVPKAGGPETKGILWGEEEFPMSVRAGDERWTIALSHRRWQMPFSLRLDDFRRELHPGLSMAKSFESDVTKFQDGHEQGVRISMNKPLRKDGYTVFQSGFREPMRPGSPWYSTFSVVRNPADDVPLWSCFVFTAGLLMHFTRRLVRHVRAESGRQS
jgi:hypothetical protein